MEVAQVKIVKLKEMKKIIIGKEGNQPFPITDEYVSRQHAIFTYDELTGVMTLADQASANGTFVKMGNQFQQISQCGVDATTDIRLGPYFTFRVGQLFQNPVKKTPAVTVQKPKVEKVDIAYLRRVAENFEETKLQLEQRQSNVNSLRTLSLVGSFLGGGISAIIPSLVGHDVDLYVKLIGPLIATVFLISLMLYCSKVSRDIIVKKNQNEKNYKISFCCPKCHVPFAGKLYENILAEGKCPKCKVEFHDSKM